MFGRAASVRWPNPRVLEDHFRRHGAELGCATAAEYDRSARLAIQHGRRFTYEDRQSSELRSGYFDAMTGRFTVLNDAEAEIVTHYRATRRYVRRLKDSTY